MRYICDIETAPANLADVLDKLGNYKPFPLKEKIICISIINVETNELQSFSGEDEKHVLYRLWSSLKEGDELVGFCNANFDYPYLLIRSLVNNVLVTKIKILDLRVVLCNVQIFKGKLSEYASALGYQATTKNGSQMYNLFIEKKWSEIIAHCEEDVKMTQLLFDRMCKCNII